MSNLLQDLKHTFRALRHNPGFTLAAILALALGIGANTAIFSVVNAVLIRSLPFGDPDRLVQIWHTPPERSFPGTKIFAVSAANYLDWQRQNHSFEKMAIIAFRRRVLTGSGEPESLEARAVSSDFFSVLQSNPLLGRSFSPEEDQPGHDRVAVLSYRLWQEHFAADPHIVGKAIQLDSQNYIVIGVMGDEFRYPSGAALWTPLAMTDQERAVRGEHNYLVIARLKPGVSLLQGQAELDTISSRLAQQYPEDDAGWGAVIHPLREELVGDVRPALLILLGAVALVLLIACANVANLVLARTLTKRKEIAIRKALGANRSRVVQQVVCESVLLSFGGGILGLLFAHFGTILIVKFLANKLPHFGDIGLNPRVLIFTLGVSVLTGILAGLLPAWQLTKTNMNEALKQGLGRTDSDSSGSRTRNILVVSEVALSLMLLIGAGLLIRSLWQLRAVDAGFETSHEVSMRLAVPSNKFSSANQQSQFYQETLNRVRTLPGIEAAGAIDSLPFAGGSIQPFSIEGHPAAAMSEQPEVAVRFITPGYRDAMRIPLKQGRDFNDADTVDRPGVVLISAAMAKQFWPNQNPIGQHLTLTFSHSIHEIVGVIGDVKQWGLASTQGAATLYVPFDQIRGPDTEKWHSYSASLVVRTAVPPGSIIPEAIQAIHQVDREVPITNVFTLDDYVEESLSQQRFSMLLLGAFAGMALLLTALGIYSVLSYAVRRRVREIGIRIALGAQLSDVLRMVLVDGLKPILVGIVIGVAGALTLTRVLHSILYGVSTTDTTTFMTGSLLLITIGIAASLVPAYRATRVEPMETLRDE